MAASSQLPVGTVASEAAIPGLHAKMVEHIRWLEAEFKLVASDFAEFSMHSAHRTAETDPMHSTFI